MREEVNLKVKLEEDFRQIEQESLARLSDFEGKFENIKKMLLKSKEEVEKFKASELKMRESEAGMRLELAAAEKTNYKTQYMEMREVNKDLKAHFKVLE